MKSIHHLLLITLCLASHLTTGQAKIRKLPPNINHPSINNFAPYMSLDGNTLVYIADVGEDNELTMNFSTREGVNWKDPVMMPKSVNNHLNFLKGYGLSPDGKTLYITNMRSNGMGGFDLYTSQWLGSSWTEPVNMLLPANSKSNDACASVSIDGNTMYFMRCEKMDFTKAEKCKLMMMKKKSNGQWDIPVELPSFINSGNSQTPRIMGDGETLLFSSDQLLPNKGGMDLYFTKSVDGQWSHPQPLDFVNTPQDDQYISASSLGRYLVKEAKGQRNTELVEILFPLEIRPKATTKIEGVVAGPPDPSTAFVSVFIPGSKQAVFSTKPLPNGTFVAYLKEGNVYDLSVDPEKDNFTFYSKSYDLTGDKIPLIEKVIVRLKPAEAGDEIELNGISFIPHSSNLSATSAQELRRVVRLIQGNPDKKFSIQVTMSGYEKDSLQSSPDLTEVIHDTVKIPITYKIQPKDSTDSVTVAVRDSLVVHSTYHNDRTLAQAKAIGEQLVRAGIPSGRVACSGKALPEAILENRRTQVKIVIH